MPNITKLDIKMEYTSATTHLPSEWAKALFQCDSLAIRTFSNVKEFNISTRNTSAVDFQYDAMFRALPRARHVSLDLPGIAAHGLYNLCNYSLLQDLHSIRLTNFDPVGLKCFASFMDDLKSKEDLQEFREMEVDARCTLSSGKASLESVLGEKLVWKT